MRILFIVCALWCSSGIYAFSLRPDAPARYVVQQGDTLWSIAGHYLDKPWEWKALWHANPAIKNPNSIYPGAILSLRRHNGASYLKVLSNGTIKLSPRMRPMPATQAVPPIALIELRPFFNESMVMDQNLLLHSPYIVSFSGEHLLGGQGNEAFVRHLHPSETVPDGVSISYAIYRPECCPYLEPKSNRELGYKATLVGYGVLTRAGEPATILLTDITEGIRLNDRVLYNDFPEFKLSFEPKAPLFPLRGSIIDFLGDFSQGAKGFIAVLDRGEDAGLEPGDVLGIYTQRRLVCNAMCPDDPVLLPAERIGELMVFRTFSQTSFALVVRSTRAIHIKDHVTNP